VKGTNSTYGSDEYTIEEHTLIFSVFGSKYNSVNYPPIETSDYTIPDAVIQEINNKE